MLGKIAAFEFRYQIRNPVFFVTFALFALLAFGNVTSDNVNLAATGNVNIDSPDAISQVHLTLSVISLLIVTAFLANIVLRDTELRTDGILYSTRITKGDYLFGRFIGAFAVSFLVFSATTFGTLLGTWMPWLDPERLGGFHADYYIYGLFVIGLPNLLFTGAIAFAVATLTRSLMLTYAAMVAMVALFAIAGTMLGEPEFRTIASLMDPFGGTAYGEVTRYWTAFERNEQLVPLEGLFLYNRLLWSGIALLLVGATYWIFRFDTETRKSRKLRKQKEALQTTVEPIETNQEMPVVAPVFNTTTMLRQFWLRVRFEVWSVVRSVPFLVLVVLSIVLATGSFISLDQILGTSVWPVTRVLTNIMSGTFTLAIIIIIVYYGAEIVWQEHQLGFNEILDATPTPNWVFAGSKLVAILLVMVILLAVGVIVSMLVQLFSGYTNFEFGAYMTLHMMDYGRIAYMAAILSVFVQVLVRNKYLGMGIMVVYIVSLFALIPMGYEDPLYRLASTPGRPYSDMNGWGHYGWISFLYTAYWAFVCVLMFVGSELLWKRGVVESLGSRIAAARHAITPRIAALSAIAIVGWIGLGSYIFYNTRILNEYQTVEDRELIQVEYEKRFLKYKDIPQPRIIDVYADVDIYPSERRYAIRGRYILENRTDQALDEALVAFSNTALVDSVEMEGATVREHDEDYNATLFAFDNAMAPGERRTLNFEVRRENPGFLHRQNQTAIIDNGTFFFNYDVMPGLGFFEGALLTDRNTRRKYDLEPIDRAAKLEDEAARRNSYLRQDSDWIGYETVVSTEAGQTAIAPGYLIRDWVEGDRHYFHYKMDTPMQHLFAYLSADYESVGETWNGIDIEVLYDKAHPYNIDRMIDSVKKAISYCSENFSPYQYRQMRIIEFPITSGRFATAYPNTVPWSEGIGFIAKLEDETAIDYVFYVGAHEVAHQWWGHQVSSANVQGGTVLIETLAQYSALMIMEKEYGPDVMRRFLKYELDRYLTGRGGEAIEELPLYRVENQQYIHYRKGSVVMYALKDYLGEEAINRALANLIEEASYRYDPYPTSLDLIRNLRAVAETPAQQDLITDLFERIVIFDLSVDTVEVAETDDGRFNVSMDIVARKFEADGEGKETEMPLDMEIDIGLFTMDPDAEGFGEDAVIQLDKQLIRGGESTLDFTVDRRPVRVGIDPYNKLIDRNSDDNLKTVGTSGS